MPAARVSFPTPLALLAIALFAWLPSSTALAQDPADDPSDLAVEPTPADVPPQPAWAPFVDPRLAPEPSLDPYSDERGALDPADETVRPSGEAREHDPFTAGEPTVPPFSASVDCPDGTVERRTLRAVGPELWCADERGRRHGPLVSLYPSGSPRLRGTYVEGRRHGAFHWWYPSGRLEGRAAYVRGLEHGVEELYYESGRLRAETTFHEGKKHGPHRAWHESGRLAAKGTFVHGERAGDWSFFDEDGAPTDPPPSAAKEPDTDSRTPSVDEGPPLSSRLTAAAAGGVGATAGLALGAGAAFLVFHLKLLDDVDPRGWLPFLLVPPVFAAAGGALGTVLFTRFPGPVMAGVGAAFGIPAGAVLGGLVGGALAGAFGLGVVALGASSEAALGLLLSGAMVGAVAGAAVGPGALGALSAWLYADGPKGVE